MGATGRVWQRVRLALGGGRPRLALTLNPLALWQQSRPRARRLAEMAMAPGGVGSNANAGMGVGAGIGSSGELTLIDGEICLRDLRREDADEIARWPHYTEPDLLWANYHFRGPADKDLWYRFSISDPSQIRLAITRVDGGEVIGLIGLRHINRSVGNATLGIRMSPDVVGRGLGTSSVRAIVRYAFDPVGMGLKRVFLDVVEGNMRARRCYEKVGFVYINRRVLPDNSVMLDMRITREEFAAAGG